MKTTDNIKTASISLRCTPEEKAKLIRLAEKKEKSVGDYLITAGLYSEGMKFNVAALPEICTLITEYKRKSISKKDFIDEIIRKVEELCQ